MRIPLDLWTNLLMAQKRKHLDLVNNLNNDELKNMQTIEESFWNIDENIICERF